MSFPSVMKKPNWLSLQMLALKVKLHIVNCELHGEENVLEFFEGPTAYNIDFEIEQPSEVYETLKSSFYIRYSTIIILINCDCSCHSKVLTKLLTAIEGNKYLKYKLKIIYTSYQLKTKNKQQENIWTEHFKKHEDIFERNKIKHLKNDTINLNDLLNSYPFDTGQITYDDKEPLRDYFNFKLSKVENVLFFQLFIKPGDWLCRAQNLDYILYVNDCLPLISAQELLTFLRNPHLAVHAKSDMELYFYNLNPALAVINNNYLFTNGRLGISTRQGSERDVLKLIRELKIAHIPFILTEDFSRAQFLDFIKYLKEKNLRALKSLIFIMMSHATTNNIIYTHDGELNFIEDILLPLQANETLKETNISYINVHCRGGLDAQNTDPDEFDEIQDTHIEQLQPNNTIFYSVPDLVISPRRNNKGTPFVDSFCKSFRDLNPQNDIRILFEKTWQDLKNDSYYSYLDCFDKSSELVVGDDKKLYSIKPTPTGAKEFLPLVESIEQEFHKLNKMKQLDRSGMKFWIQLYLESLQQKDQPTVTTSESAATSFCICANVNEQKMEKNLDKFKYFAAELDEDSFIVDES